ncbi:MAG: hypothetical protein RBR67_10855 [Desulfobacterium sp.]|jgi:hypothetical protein|nr:hypothetical protein [Desulfobacterium sp.]
MVSGKVNLNGDILNVQGHGVAVNRGTPALLAAALKACEVLERRDVTAFLVGDIGLGGGSRKLYNHLVILQITFRP